MPEGPSEPNVAARNPVEADQLDASMEARDRFDDAAAAGDWDEADQSWDVMKQQAGTATLEVLADGGDPARETRPVGMFLHPQIEMGRRFMAFEGRRQSLNNFILNDPEIGQVKDYMRGVFEQYRDRNEEELEEWNPAMMSPEQKFNYQMQLQPVQRDPNEVADMRSMLVSIDQRMKEIDESFSVFTHPETAKWAGWLNREAGDTGLGYLASGEQPLEMGVAGRGVYMAAEAIETATDPILAAGYQMWEWTDQGMRGMGLPSIAPPRNYIEGPDGQIYYNQERPHPGLFEATQSAWSLALGQDVAKEVASLNRTRNMEKAQRAGWTNLLHGTVNVAGVFLGFGLPAGAAMSGGAMTFAKASKSGLAALAGLGVKGAASARALKLTEVWGGRLGGAAGLGGFQATAYGKQQGYLNQFAHGMAMMPVLAVLGHYGPRLEKVLQQRAKLPPKVAGMLSEGMVMGAPFAAMEWAEVGLWEHLQNPNESTADIFLKNIMGAMLFKGAFGGTAPTMQQQAMMAARVHVERSQARAKFAEDVAEGRVDPAKIEAQFEGKLSEFDIVKLSELIRKERQTTNLAERMELSERRREFEQELDVKEYALEQKVEKELEQITREEEAGEPPKVQKEFREEAIEERKLKEAGEDPLNLKRELEELKSKTSAEGITPKNRQKMLELLQRSRGEPLAKMAEGIGKEVERQGKIDQAMIKELGEAQLTVLAMKYGVEVSDLKKLQRAKEPVPIEVAAKPLESLELGSIKAGEFPTEATEGIAKATLDDIFAEMGGRLPRKGVRVPFSPVRVGGKAGDPVRPAFRKGRIGGGKGVLGLYKIFENLIRTRVGKDMVTATHEWSHDMQRVMLAERGGKEFVDAAKEWVNQLPPELLKEFPSVLEGYANWENLSLHRQGMEVWAEAYARKLLNDVTLDKQAPNLSAYFDGLMAKPENAAIRNQFLRIQSSILRYQQIGARGRLEASIIEVSEKPSEAVKATEPTKLDRARDYVLREFFDDILTLKRGAEKWVEAAGVDPAKIGIMEDPARVWDALRMTAGKQADHFVMRGITTPDGKRVPGMREILLSEGVKGRNKEFRNYLVAVLNAQRIKRGKEATLPMADYVSEIRRLQTENPRFREAARELKEWTDTVVDWVAQSGNLAPEQAQKIKDAYVLWVPFMRAMEGPSARGGALGRKVGPVREGVGKVRAGGKERIKDPLMAMTDTVTQMVSNAHRNMVVSALYKMAVGHEAGGLATRVKKTSVPKDHPLKDILDAIERQVELPGEAQFHMEDMISALRDANALDPQTLTMFAQKSTPAGEKNVMAFTPRMSEAEIVRTARGDKTLEEIIRNEQGKSVWLEFDPVIYETLMGLDVPPMHKFLDEGVIGWLFTKTTALRRTFATGVAPGFVVANMFRDALSTPIFSQDGRFRMPGAGFVDMFKGAASYLDKTPGGIRELYDSLGVRVSSFSSEGQLKKITGEARGFREKWSANWAKLENFFGHPENFIRINEFRKIYEKAKTEGRTETEARMLALEAGKEITVNFARGGIYAKMFNRMTPYFNASLQGQRKVWRQIVHGGDGKNDAQRARIQRAAIGNGIANITMPAMLLWWMNHEEEWYQDLPAWRKTMFFNMKMGDSILSLPKPFEAGFIFGAIPELFMEAYVNEGGTVPTVFDALADGLFPYLKGPGDFLPALIQPMVEITANYDFFRKRPLTPEWIKSTRVRTEQTTFYTSATAKILSEAINGIGTPIQVEKFLGGYTSGAGTNIMRSLDEITGMKDHPGLRANPFKRFVTQPHRAGYYQDELYRTAKELDQKAGSKTATGAELALRGQVNQAKERFSDLSRAVRSGGMSATEAERLKFEIARPLVERYEEIK
jgi:hypothetical protein